MNLPSKKALTYMRCMISSGNWKPNEKIPTINTIAKTLQISTPTVRKALRKLENDKTIQNYDSLGFFVLSDVLVQEHKRSKTSFLIHMASVNLNMAEIEHYKQKLFGSYGISYDSKTNKILAHNIITHISITTTLDELKEIIQTPITIKSILESDTKKLAILKRKYIKQQKLLKLARIVNLNRKELGISYE